MTTGIQMVNSPNVDRRDHVWNRIEIVEKKEDKEISITKYKCVLCGGLDENPPPYPTPQDWCLSTVEELTNEERALCKRKALNV